jgi:hypothetical protein
VVFGIGHAEDNAAGRICFSYAGSGIKRVGQKRPEAQEKRDTQGTEAIQISYNAFVAAAEFNVVFQNLLAIHRISDIMCIKYLRRFRNETYEYCA